MVEELRQVFERAMLLPEDAQRHLAEVLRQELEDEETREWEPTAEERADIEASRAEYAAGNSHPYEEYLRDRSAREQ